MPDLRQEEFRCEVIVLGLRGLVTTGLLPIRKAYLMFSLKSLLPPDQAKAIKNIYTQPRESGPNPNINTDLQFDIELPTDQHFCPRMTCYVHDQLYLEGLPQPQIGTFAIRLGDIILEQEDKMNKFIESLRANLEDLGRIEAEMKKKKLGQAKVEDIVIKLLDERRQIEQAAAREQSQLPGLNEQGFRSAMKGRASVRGKFSKLLMTIEQQFSKFNAQGGSHHDSIAIRSLSTSDQVARMKHELKTNLRKRLQEEYEKAMAAQAQQVQADREKAREGRSGFPNVVRPQYKLDERLKIDLEVNRPPESWFIELGHDSSPGAGEKHYRLFYPEELEKVKDQFG